MNEPRRPRRRVAKTLILLFGSTILALYAADVFLSRWIWARSRLHVLGKLRSQGVQAYPLVMPYLFVQPFRADPAHPRWLEVRGQPVLPLGGISERVTLLCSEGSQDFLYVSDQHGFHNPPGLWGGSSVDLVAVGDSFTQGFCVGSDENLVAGIRRRHPSTVNLGMGGNGPLIMLGTLREYLPRLRPRVVLWCHSSANDVLDLRAERTHPILARYLRADFTQGLAESQADIDHALQAYVDHEGRRLLEREEDRWQGFVDTLLLRHVRAWIVRSVRQWRSGRDSQDRDATDEDYAAFADLLGRADAVARSVGARMVFVYLPAWPELFGPDGSRQAARRHRERVQATAAALGLQVVDVGKAFASQPEPALFPCPGCHYSPQGYALAAARVTEALDPELSRGRPAP